MTATKVLGSETIVHASTAAEERLSLTLPGIRGLEPGAVLRVDFPPQFVHLFDAAAPQ